MRELFKTVELIQAQLNPRLQILGILPTMYDRRTRMNRSMLQTIREYFQAKVVGHGHSYEQSADGMSDCGRADHTLCPACARRATIGTWLRSLCVDMAEERVSDLHAVFERMFAKRPGSTVIAGHSLFRRTRAGSSRSLLALSSTPRDVLSHRLLHHPVTHGRRLWRNGGVAVDALLLVGWLISVAAVVFYEKGNQWGGFVNPMSSLVAPLEAQEQWFGIYYNDQKIGFAKTVVLPSDVEGIPGISVTDSGQLAMTLLGSPQRLTINARAFIDADWRLQFFSAKVRSETYSLEWEGIRKGDVFIITLKTPSSTTTTRLRDPTGTLLVHGFSPWMAFHRLSVGQSGKAWVLNPLALKPEELYFYVRRKEVIDGQEALVIESDLAGMTTTSWVTPSGQVLREHSPLGWQLKHQTEQEIIQQATPIVPSFDFLSATAVPIDHLLDDPAKIERLILLVEGLSEKQLSIHRPWQKVLHPDAGIAHAPVARDVPFCILRLDRPRGITATSSEKAPPQRYQQPSLFVQSDDARIQAKAREIVGSRTDPWEKVQALNAWVFGTLIKRLTVGLPSAVDVLIRLQGDCHEHTILFTALARSQNLPARMVAGLVYQAGRFYYHAWPEVWIGQWIPTDPTLGQDVADVTHIGLTEAEGSDLVNLAQFVGQLRVQVLQVVASDPQQTPGIQIEDTR